MKDKSHILAKHRKYSELVWQLLISAMLVLPLAPMASAAEVSNRFIINTSIERNSNPALVESAETPVWLYTLLPQYNLNVSDGLNVWYLESALLLQKPSNNEVFFDRQDPRLLLGWNRTYQSGTYGLRAGYEQSAGIILQVLSRGAVVNANIKQRTKFIEANWQHDFSARWSLVNQATYNRTKFEGLPAAEGVGTGFVDFDVSEVKSKLAFANTEKLSTYAELGYLQFMPRAFIDDTDLHRFQLGANYLIKEGLTVGAYGGLYTVSDRQSDSGWEAGIQANYTLERVDYSAKLARTLVPGIFGFQLTDAFEAAWGYNISERNLVGADYSFSKNEGDDLVGLPAIDNHTLGAYYERRLSNHWKTRFLASYLMIDIDGSERKGNLIGVTLTYDTAGF